MKSIQLRTMLPGILCIVALAGCSVTTHDKGSGKKEDVDIRTPFGSLSVKEGATDIKDTGLSAYPGARLAKDGDDERHHSANVNISSSLFGLKVVALKYESDDASDKVLAYYRKEMGKYGNVVDCTGGGFNMKFHHHDKDAEVTCDDHSGSDHNYKEQLKVGTENNQRILAIKPKGNGSEFALVYVRAWGGNDTN